MSDIARLVEAVRKAALPAIWSKGVNLSRANAVAVESSSPREWELKVKAPGRPVAWGVTLFPQDVEWSCECPSRVDPCEHVVAAALSLQQADKQEVPLAAVAEKWARVVYKFSRVPGGLALQRVLVQADGTEAPLDSLMSLLAKPAVAATLKVDDCDLTADRFLEKPRRGPMAPERLDALLRILEPSRNVLLDGREVAISDELLLPRALVEDRGEQVTVTVVRDPSVTDVVCAGVALCGDALCRLGETGLTGSMLQGLPSVRTFPPEQVGELMSQVLPDLAARIPVEVRSRRLPPVDRELKPRIQLELNQLESGVSVLPTLVYGAPPCVRIDAGRMVYLHGAVPVRDQAAEQKLIHQLREELDFIPGRRTTVAGRDLLRFLDRVNRWHGDLTGDAAGVVNPHAKLRPILVVESGPNPGGMNAPAVRFSLRFEVEGASDGKTHQVDGVAVMRAWSEGLGLVALEGGGWAPLPRSWLEKNGQRVADLLAAREEDGRLANHALPQLNALCETLEYPPPPGLDRLAPLVSGFDRLPEVSLPPDVTATLRPYQQEGVRWIHFLRSTGLGGVLADDMGLGKTLQTLCVLGSRSLVVCPTSVLPNWQAEIKRFRPSLRVAVYHGPGRALDATADITLTTYALLRLDASVLSGPTWDAVVLDEAQAIKNPDSKVARAAYGLKASFHLALTGTPVENRLMDLWSLMHFANRGLLGGRKDFEDQVAKPIADGRRDGIERLRTRIKPFVLRRLKRDVALDLPPRTESIMHVTLDERERTVYDTVYAATREEVVALLNAGGSVLKALEALLRLRQAACHSALVPGQQAASSSKVDTLVEALETAVADGHKALVFSQWTSLLDLIEPALTKATIAYERLDGSTRDRGEVTNRFQSPQGAPVMLISLKAGGTGLNLTAADHVFLVDPWWNPAVEAQAADRAHRIGQDKPVMVYRLVSTGTVEEKILGLQEKKRALFEAALGDASSATSLTREDLLQLFA